VIIAILWGTLAWGGAPGSACAEFEDVDPAVWERPVAEIRIEGLNRTRQYIVTRHLRTTVGRPLRAGDLEEEYSVFDQLDIFAEVEILPVPGPDGVVVTYRFVELFRFLPSLGLKFSDESGVSVGAGVKMPNFLGRGILMSARFLVGGLTELEFWLDDPWTFGNHWGYRVEYYHREKENLTVDFNERTDEVYLWTGPRIGEFGRVGAHFSYIDMRADRDGITLGPDRRDQTARLGLYVGYETLDSYLNTSTGWHNQIQYTEELAFLKKNGGTYGQWDFDFRRYVHLGGPHVLAGFSLTTIRGGAIGDQVAPWELFAVGGTNTVRGWDFAARRGKNQMLNTFEYRFNLLEPRFWDLPLGFRYRGGLQLAAFVDYGIGWDQEDEFATNNFIAGYGAGLRLLIPIVGMARLDVGFGEDALHKIYLHLGSFEKATMARRRVR